jgi:hypothetical protein
MSERLFRSKVRPRRTGQHALQAGADLASLSAGVDALATDVAGLDSGFGALQAGLNESGPELDGLYADAERLTAMVEALEALGTGGG